MTHKPAYITDEILQVLHEEKLRVEMEIQSKKNNMQTCQDRLYALGQQLNVKHQALSQRKLMLEENKRKFVQFAGSPVMREELISHGERLAAEIEAIEQQTAEIREAVVATSRQLMDAITAYHKALSSRQRMLDSIDEHIRARQRDLHKNKT